VLDLFSGLGGWSKAFMDRGHSVTTIDLDYKFNPTYVRNIGLIEDLSIYGSFDVILASPPCEKFSVASAYLYWHNGTPTNIVLPYIDLVKHTIKLIDNANPKFYVVENPRGMLRKVLGTPNAHVNYCAYGLKYKKPTDLWGKLPFSFTPKKCVGDECKHIRVKHSWDKWGKNQGIRGNIKQASQRALIPYQLSLAMCLACEKDIGITTV
jgi:hypothetical protein